MFYQEHSIVTQVYGQVGGYQMLVDWANSAAGYFTGNVGPVMLYNRVISSTEVAQNFNAHRGRYGL